jgi:hypothetical protein
VTAVRDIVSPHRHDHHEQIAVYATQMDIEGIDCQAVNSLFFLVQNVVQSQALVYPAINLLVL